MAKSSPASGAKKAPSKATKSPASKKRAVKMTCSCVQSACEAEGRRQASACPDGCDAGRSGEEDRREGGEGARRRQYGKTASDSTAKAPNNRPAEVAVRREVPRTPAPGASHRASHVYPTGLQPAGRSRLSGRRLRAWRCPVRPRGAQLGLVDHYSAGQSCEARSRVLVERPLYDDFVAKFSELASGLKVGDPLDLRLRVEGVADLQSPTRARRTWRRSRRRSTARPAPASAPRSSGRPSSRSTRPSSGSRCRGSRRRRRCSGSCRRARGSRA